MAIRIHLQPKQEQLYDLIAQTGPDIPTIIGGGGAKGGGKSRGTRSISIQLAAELGAKYPGITITIVRRVYRDLADNHIDPILRENPELYPYWSAGKEQIKLPGAGTISYRYAETSDDVKRKFLGGYESAIIIVDEAQQFSQEELQHISTACRWTDAVGIPDGLCKLVLLFNPGGISAAFLRRVFWLRQYEEREHAHSYRFIHIFGWDNYEWFRGQVDLTEKQFYRLPSQCGLGVESLGEGRCCRFHLFVRETSEGRKYNAYPASIRMGYLLGNFDHFEGQYFAGVWGPWVACTASQAEELIQAWWTRWCGFDWGFGHHAANGWASAGKVSPAVLLDVLGITSAVALDVIVIYRELVVTRTPEYELAQRIVDMTPEKERREIRRWFAGWDVWSKDRNAENTVSDLMEACAVKAGLPRMERAVIDRVPGWRTLHDCFRRTLALRSGQEAADVGPGPILLISQACPGILSAMPVLVCDPKRMEDVLKLETAEDDIADMLRYTVESYLKAKTEAPVEVRAKEAYYSVEDMTDKAMVMRDFEERERKKTLVGRRYRNG